MKVTRITNRGRIAPSSPKPIIDSGRASWSTASVVSTIETQSPEPNLTEQVTQKLQPMLTTSSLKKKLIIGLASLAALTCIAIIVGTAIHFTLSNSPSDLSSSSSVTATTTTVK